MLGRGREADARRAIAGLNAVSETDPLVQEFIAELSVAIQEENEVRASTLRRYRLVLIAPQGGHATWAECFSTRNMLWKRTGNGMMLQFIQQLVRRSASRALSAVCSHAAERTKLLLLLRRHVLPVRWHIVRIYLRRYCPHFIHIVDFRHT